MLPDARRTSVLVLGVAVLLTACTTLQIGIESPATPAPDPAGTGAALLRTQAVATGTALRLTALSGAAATPTATPTGTPAATLTTTPTGSAPNAVAESSPLNP